jgi:hypothetical protein
MDYLLYSDTYMPLITLLVYISLWKHINRQELVIFVYCCINVILFALTNVFAYLRINNMPLYHISSLIELWIIAFYLLKKITGKTFSIPFFVITIGYTIFFICNILFWEDWFVFSSNSSGVTSLVILFLCMFYLLKLSKSEEILYFQRLPAFWIASGFLIYNAVSILVVLSYKYFTYAKMPEQGDRLWFVLSAAIIIKFAIISTGLICHRKRPITHLPFLL